MTTSDELMELTVQELLSTAREFSLVVPSRVRNGGKQLLRSKRPPKRKRIEGEGDVHEQARPPVRRRQLPTFDINMYLNAPSEEVLQSCQRRFIDRTSNHALKNWICGVCARERDHLGPDFEPSTISVDRVPNPHKLYPRQPHRDHNIYAGMLLDPAGLHPKIGGAATADSNQRAMRGNVCSFEQDMSGIAAMVEGDLLPRPLSILPSVLSVTYVGPGPLPSGWLYDTFKKYFGNVKLSEDRLEAVPEDGVPKEIEACIMHNEDADAVEEEHGGYAPRDEGDSTAHADVEAPSQRSSEGETRAEVVPFDVAGSLDTDLHKMSASELLAWGLANLWLEGEEGGYIVRHGSRFVSDFGPGGRRQRREADFTVGDHHKEENFFEKAYPMLFPYGRGGLEATRRHVRWCMRYHDRRFFVVFGILQKREALGDALAITSITTEALEKAVTEEANGLPISDPAVKLLRSYVHSTAMRVMGTDTARIRLRSQIWSSCLADIHDPIAQVFAGAEIDMDAFANTAGPDKQQRAVTIAQDPYAAAKYFHFIFLGVRVSPFRTTTEDGIFGRGRGTLHLHMLVFLDNTPNSGEMHTMLQDPSYRDRVVRFIRSSIRAYLPGLESREDAEVPYSRPVHPDDPDFELKVARMQQVHACHRRRCLVVDKQGTLRCKRGAPFERNEDDFFVNAWNPCNNDINITFYCTSYAGKKQQKSHSQSALMAKGYAYHETTSDYLDSMRDRNRLLLNRLELAAPMVMSYLMGWGDVYRSHHYTTVYWTTFTRMLYACYPLLQGQVTPSIQRLLSAYLL
ncbi:hypothetical protein FB107DRAFT_285550 [Schizophyllum commune]